MELGQSGRVLAATWDGAGNLPPVLTLVQGLVGKGHDVHVLGHDSSRQKFEREGGQFHPWRNTRPTDYVHEGLSAEREAEFAKEHLFYGRGYQIDLHSAINELSPDVVLVDVSLRYAILEALRARRPLVVLCHTLYGALMGGEDPLDPYFLDLNEAAARAGLQPFTSRQQMVESADQVLVFSYGPFDPLAGDAVGDNVLHVGPLRSFRSSGETWSRKHPDRDLVLISLSTSNQFQGALLQRLCDTCETLDIEALVTTGPIIRPDELDVPDNVTAAQFIPHDRVLPDANLLITHAGHGTVMAGVTYGVPMLCLPMGRDQPFIAHRVETLGLGTTLDMAAPVDFLQRTVIGLLEDQSLRRRARDFSASLQGHAGVGEALEAIHRVSLPG